MISVIKMGEVTGLPDSTLKHYYYKTLQEQKQIDKTEKKFKKSEHKRKLKQLAKQWKIEYSKYFETDIDKLEEENFENISQNAERNANEKKLVNGMTIPKGFNSFEDVIYYEENEDRMKYHKRTTENIRDCLENILYSNKNKILSNVTQNMNINISNIKVNRAITSVEVFFNLPEIEDIMSSFYQNQDMLLRCKLITIEEIEEIAKKSMNKDEEEKQRKETIYKHMEDRLNSYSKLISKEMSEYISFKYRLQIKFLKDTLLENLEKLNTFSIEKNQLHTKKLEHENKRKQEENKRETELFELVDTLLKKNYFKYEFLDKFKQMLKDTKKESVQKNIKIAIDLLENFDGNLEELVEFIDSSEGEEGDELNNLENNTFIKVILNKYYDLETKFNNLERNELQIVEKHLKSKTNTNEVEIENINKDENINPPSIELTDGALARREKLKNQAIKDAKKLKIDLEALKNNTSYETGELMKAYTQNHNQKILLSSNSGKLRETLEKDMLNLENNKRFNDRILESEKKLLSDMGISSKKQVKDRKKQIDFWLKLTKDQNI